MEPKFDPFPQLETKRLILRQLKDYDADFLYELRTTPKNNKYLDLPIPSGTDEALAYITRMNRGISEQRHIYWAITKKEDGEMVGTICLWNFDAAQRLVELGYELLFTYQKQGYMREALTKVMTYAFDTLAADALVAYTHKENSSSIRLLQYYGFLPSGTIQETNSKGQAVELAIYRKKKSFLL